MKHQTAPLKPPRARFCPRGALADDRSVPGGYPEGAGADNLNIRLPLEFGLDDIRRADVNSALPVISPEAVEGLKFSAALPPGLASATLAARFVDRAGAQDVMERPFVSKLVET